MYKLIKWKEMIVRKLLVAYIKYGKIQINKVMKWWSLELFYQNKIKNIYKYVMHCPISLLFAFQCSIRLEVLFKLCWVMLSFV